MNRTARIVSIYSVTLMILGLLQSQSIRADESAIRPVRTRAIEKFRAPQWENSLKGYGNLNVNRAPASKAPGAQGESQFGPIRVGQTGAVPPPSFMGSLSRFEHLP